MPRLKAVVEAADRIPMRARIGLVIVAAVVAIVVVVVRDDGSGDRRFARAEGDVAGVAGVAERSSYLGPGDGGRGWIRSRPGRMSVVWAAGDGANGSPQASAVATMIASQRVDRFLYLGDVYQAGTAREYEENYRPSFGRLDQVAAPTIGNHEWPNASTGYIPYWTGARGSPPPFWYAFAASGWQLISLNTNPPAATSPAQLGWLQATIGRTQRYGNCRTAFFHHPIYSAGLHGDVPGLEPVRSALEGNASIVLSGHDHDLQRLRPINGITQLVSGAAGARVYPVNRDDPRLAFFDDTHHGAVRLRLTPGRAVVSFVASDGTLLDRSVVRCSQAG